MYEIIPGRLFQSRVLTDWREVTSRGIRVVISLVPEGLPLPPPLGVVYLAWPIEDAELPDEGILWAIASLGADCLLECSVCCQCAEGMNRSGLLCACILAKWQNIPVQEAIVRVRRAVPGALSNPQFAAYLEQGCAI